MEEIKQLLEITASLRERYKKDKRKFTLDGNLVGDIGEVLANEYYKIKLYPSGTKVHDAEELNTGKKVQIKSTMRKLSYFPKNDLPDYFLSLHITEKGEIEELYNGPSSFLQEEYISALKVPKRSYYSLSANKLLKLNERVKKEMPTERIQSLK